MREYAVVIEVWYDADSQEEADKKAGIYCGVLSNWDDNINCIEIDKMPEEQ